MTVVSTRCKRRRPREGPGSRCAGHRWRRRPDNLNTTEIASFALRLSVDPRYITSWGYFNDAGFVSSVPVAQISDPKNLNAPVVFAAVGDQQDTRNIPNIKEVAFAMSSFEPNVLQFPGRKYTNGSPLLPLPSHVADTWAVFKATTNLAASEDYFKLKNKMMPVAYEKAKHHRGQERQHAGLRAGGLRDIDRWHDQHAWGRWFFGRIS